VSLQNVLPYIVRARAEGWAVGAFNAVNMEQAQAIAWAAETERAPAMIQISHRALLYAGNGDWQAGLEMMAAVGRTAAGAVSVPVAVHLDHAVSADEVRMALRLGFTSVMFDAGALPLAENLALTRTLAQEAHAAGASLEAEVGEVPRLNSNMPAEPGESLTDPAEAAEFAARSGADLLAIAIGSVHAVRSKHVELDLPRLRAIAAAVSQPLVLHGSSGVTDDSLMAGIPFGLAKINVATQLSQGFTAAVRRTLAEDPLNPDLRPYLTAGRAGMLAVVRERLRKFNSAGKATPADGQEG
jgi:fructose-bisphosphate aldolase, class II